MKLKFKYTETKKFLLNFDKETLGELTTSVKNFIADSYGDNLDAVALSLNGQDPLLGSNKTLNEFGIVSSDLIMILTGDLALAAMIHNSEQGNEGELTSNNGPSKDAFSSESISSTSKEKADHGAASSRMAASKPCSLIDVKDSSSVPDSLEQLLSSCQTSVPSNVINLLAHQTMVECGYNASSVVDNKMPQGWDGMVANLNYTHRNFENFSCTLVLVTMGEKKHILVSFPKQDVEITTIVTTKDYVLQSPSSGSITVSQLNNIAKLSQKLRNELLVPLQIAAHRILCLPSPFHLAGLPIELLLNILKYLDVKSAVHLSASCKRINESVYDDCIWQYYYIRDYKKSTKTNTTWLSSYKTKHNQENMSHNLPGWQQPRPYHDMQLQIYPIHPGHVPPTFPFQPHHPQPTGPYPVIPYPTPPFNPYLVDPDSPYFGGEIYNRPPPNHPGVGPFMGGDPMNPFGDPGFGGLGPGLPNPRRPRNPHGGGGAGGLEFI